MSVMGFWPENVPVPMLSREGREAIWGIDNTAMEPMVTNRAGNIWFVDPTNGTDDQGIEGQSPDAAFQTLQAAIDNTRLANYDTIYVLGSLTESVVTPDYDDVAMYINIIAAGNGRYAPSWQSEAADEVALDLRALGWRISGFRFLGQASAPCIELHHTDLGGNDIAIRTVIEGNYFDGLTTGLGGILSHGCYDVWVVNNTFSLFHNVGGTAYAMQVGTTPLAIPYRNHVMGNKVYDCDNGIIWPSNGSFFSGNLLQPVGYAYAMTAVLQTSIVANPGDDNVVWGNTLAGDYSIAGGYRAGAADVWIGNLAEDLAEAEVGDNGFTIARPA